MPGVRSASPTDRPIPPRAPLGHVLVEARPPPPAGYARASGCCPGRLPEVQAWASPRPRLPPLPAGNARAGRCCNERLPEAPAPTPVGCPRWAYTHPPAGPPPTLPRRVLPTHPCGPATLGTKRTPSADRLNRASACHAAPRPAGAARTPSHTVGRTAGGPHRRNGMARCPS